MMWEYVGIVFIILIALWIGYVLGKIKSHKFNRACKECISHNKCFWERNGYTDICFKAKGRKELKNEIKPLINQLFEALHYDWSNKQDDVKKLEKTLKEMLDLDNVWN